MSQTPLHRERANRSRTLQSLLLTIALLSSYILYAQGRSDLIRGIVYDDLGEPLPGAIVSVPSTKRGTATDMEGRFVLRLPGHYDRIEVTVRYIGMRSITTTWTGKDLVIHMKASVKELSGVQVTARPNINAIDIRSRSGVVEQVDMKRLTSTPTISLATALQGSVPGLVVINRGELGVKPEIRIRGNTSFRRGDKPNEPLYVLDGQVISPESFLTLNPADIQEIKVLKDAVANALYGVKAANGVLEITSKRGTPGPLSVSLSSNIGITLRGRRPIPMMQTAEKLEYERATRCLSAPGYVLSDSFFDQERPSDIRKIYQDLYDMAPSEDLTPYKRFAAEELERLRGIETDWFRVLMRTNVYHNHNLSLRGGSDEVTYYVSGNFSEQGGQLPGNRVWRSTLRSSLDWLLRDLGYITLSTNIGIAHTDSPNSTEYSPLQMIETLNPYETKEDRLYSYPGKRFSDLINQYKSKSDDYRVGASLGFNIQPAQWLRVDGVVGADLLLAMREQITPHDALSEQRLGKKPNELGMISAGKDHELNLTSNLRITYSRLLAEKHDLTLSANTDYYYTGGQQLTVRGHGIGTQESLAGVNKSIRGAYRPDFTGYTTRIAQMGVGLAAGYTYDEILDLFGSYKADATNLLPKGKRWNSAWAVGGGLHLLPLLGMSDGDLLSDVSLKTSLGHTASLGGVSAALTVPVFRYNQEAFYGEYFRNLYLSDMYNRDLRAEKVHNIDVGLQIGLLQDRHQLGCQLYHRKTVDALLMVSIPSSNGFRTMMQNVGVLKNEGLELSLSDSWISRDDFSLSTHLSLAYNRNMVLDLYDGPTLYGDEEDVLPQYEEGKPYDLVYGFDAIGVHPLKGVPMMRNQRGEERPFTLNPEREDLIALGHSTPPYQGSIGVTLTYKGLTVDTQFYYVFGGVKPYRSTAVRDRSTAFRNAVRGQLERTWLKEGDSDKLYPSPYRSTAELFLYPNSRMISRSDYLRMSTVSASYSLPYKLLNRITGGVVKYASLGMQASNLFTLTPYKGANPEAGLHDTGLQPVVTTNLNLTF